MLAVRNRTWETVVQRLGSLRLSFFLMVLLALLVAQRAIMAQKEVLPEDGEGVPWFLKILNTLGLDSPGSLEVPFLAAMIFFVMNLAFASVLMARKVRHRQNGLRAYRSPRDIRSLSHSTEFTLPGGGQDRVVQLFRERGFRVASETDGSETRLQAGKREAGRWGVFFFHLTFFVVLVGALVSYLTRYTGYVELSPGETFVEGRDNYARVSKHPLFFGDDKQFRIGLEEIDLSYWKPGVIKQRAAVVNLYDGSGVLRGKKRVAVNSPLKISGMKVYQGNQHGFLAGLEVTDEAGTQVSGSARFSIPEKNETSMTGRVSVPGTRLMLDLELFTERLAQIEGLEPFRSTHIATLIKVTSQEGPHRTFRGVLFGGASLAFEGLTFRFVSLKPYASFLTVQDYGVPIIFVGFFFLLLGLVVTYFWVPENYWVVIREEGTGDYIVIGATTEKFKESLKERFADQVAVLKGEATR